MTSITRRSFISAAAAGAVRLALGPMARAAGKGRSMPEIGVNSTSPANLTDSPKELVRIDYTSGVDGLKDRALVCPSSSETWVVTIHGHGSHDDQLYTRPDLEQTWLPAFLGHKLEILTPNLRDNAWRSPTAATARPSTTAQRGWIGCRGRCRMLG